MVMTTAYSGKIDAPTGDAELDSLLKEIRHRTGESWQVEVRLLKGGFFRKMPVMTYSLLVYVGGVMPYQLIAAGSGELRVTKAYLIGYLACLDSRKSSSQAGAVDEFARDCLSQLSACTTYQQVVDMLKKGVKPEVTE